MITGNEDGVKVKQCATNILFGLQHIGYVDDVIPRSRMPTGSARPDPARPFWTPVRADPRTENDFTNRNTAFMTWNLMHLARILKDGGGIPVHGNQRSQWDVGARFDFANPEYR